VPRVAVVGCGDVSIVHFEAIEAIADAELVAVCDTEPATLTAAAGRYRVPGFADHRQLVDAIAPDVVHICTPHDQHADLAIDCLRAGVGVLLEKPLAHTPAEGDRVVLAAAQYGAKIGVCLQNRYNATAQAIHSALESGRLGAVLGGFGAVMWHRPAAYYQARPWRGRWPTSGGGVMINQAIHTLDLLQWFLGEVTQFDGGVSQRLLGGDREVEDTADLVLGHSSGARSVLFATAANVVDSPVMLEIVTEEATLYVRGDLTITYADGRVEIIPERVAGSGGRAYWGVSHQLLIRDFYNRLGEDAPFWISPAEAAKSLSVIGELYARSGLSVAGGSAGPPTDGNNGTRSVPE
jgi:UDP-N-acetyl-2-amino-2-deoxyglucuronate dehydrogenase